MNIDRLQHLITILEAVPIADLRLDVWVCGTTACALGHAALDKQFQTEGLDMWHTIPECGGWTGYRAGAAFFEIPASYARHLFSPAGYRGDNPTPQDVINRIKELIDAHATAS